MFYHLEEEEPIVLVVSESNLSLTNLVVDFLESNSLKTELISLDQNFFLKYEEISKQKRRIHKIVFLFGFYSKSPEIYKIVFDFFEMLYANQNEEIPIILISSVVTSLNILDNLGEDYQKSLEGQENFLKDFFDKFKQNLVFLAQDLLIAGEKLDYPLLLFFSAFKQEYLFDPQAKFFFQDEKSFFDLIKDYLVKPHRQAKFIVKGSSISSEKLLKKIVYLYEQYFQKRLNIVKLFSDEKRRSLIKEFSSVSNSNSDIEDLIDQRIRNITKFNEQIAFIAPSEAELAKALQISRLHKKWKEKKQQEKEQFEKESKKIELLKYSDLINKTDKDDPETLKSGSFSSEFVEKIESLFSTQRKKEKTIRQEKNIDQGKKIIKKSKKRKVLFWAGLSSIGAASISLVLFLSFSLSQKKLSQQLLEAVDSNGENIENIDKSMLYRFFIFQLDKYKKVFAEENLTEAEDIKQLNNSLLAVYLGNKNFLQPAYDVYKKTMESGVDLKPIYQDLEKALENKVLAQKTFNSYLMSLNMDLYQGEEKDIWQESLSRSKEEIKDSLQYKRFLTPFSKLFFQPGRVNVLFLIQDSNELRSTGGFLTEVVLLGFSNGFLIDKQIFDVNDLDARAYGHKEADQEIKDLLGESSSYLRDSNWQADFSKSSQEAQWFVEQATGSKADIVVALNTKTISELLEAIKELKLTNGTLVNQANYQDNLEKTALLDYKNVGNSKFSWQFANSLFEKTLNLSKEEFVNFSDILIKNLNKKEILIQSNDQDLKQAIEANSWGGQKIKAVCPVEFKQENCLSDSFFQVENNIGINKINPYIKESIEHNVGISKDFIRHKRKITFENISRSDVWPLGSYKNYLKFYINPSASLEKVEINGEKIDSQRIKISNTGENLEVGILIEIPKQSKLEFALTYLVPNQMKLPFSYAFFDQKQAGVFQKNTSYNVVFEEQFKPQLIAPTATYQDKTVHFENDNSDHFFFAIDFSN